MVAGEFASGTLVLNELRRSSASTFRQARDHLLRTQTALEAQAQESTGIEPGQLQETVVLGTALNSGQGVWSLGFGNDDQRTKESVGDYGVNFPNDVPTPIKDQASRTFEAELLAAHSAQNAIGLVKAAARLIHTVAPFSASVSQRVQIGVTVANPASGHVARYFDGPTTDVLGFLPVNFFTGSEIAA